MAVYQWPDANAAWSVRDVVALLCTKMDPNDLRPVTVAAVVLAESGGKPLAVSAVRWNPTSPTHLSLDVGLFQLNTHWHTVTGPYPDVPPITVAQCLNPFTAWEQTWKVLNKARPDTWHYNLTPWSVYKSGAYERHWDAAWQGLKEYRAWLATNP